jgi:potassium efflux system protein
MGGNGNGVLFWALLFFLILREGDQRFYKETPSSPAAPYRAAQPVRWALFQLFWLLWGVLLVIYPGPGLERYPDSFLRPGEGSQIPRQCWRFQLHLAGLLSAALILFFTHLLIRLWRHVLSTRILARSGLESGLQHSMTSITVYLLWGLGVLAALHAFGLSSTSLTVAFGALGIGLGFGLQNIFNNFISGIILLFERPIQVGDAVEINGIWAEVKKINFRSTVVQTYDNASLIIPNSEFISSQVTNWSFRDLTLRIKISVGVAYGSDIELGPQQPAGNRRQDRKRARLSPPRCALLRFWRQRPDLRAAGLDRCKQHAQGRHRHPLRNRPGVQGTQH